MQTYRLTRLADSPIKLLIALNLALALVGGGLWLAAARQGLFWRADFTAFYTGWAMVLDGSSQDLYDLELQTRYQQQILEGRSFADGLLPFVNPPHVALFLAPLALFPLDVAYLIWSAANAALIILATRLLLQVDPEQGPAGRLLTVATFLAFPPLWFAVLRGTFSVLALVALLMVYHSARRNQPLRVGWGLLLLTFKPQLAIAPGSVLLGGRRWAMLAAGAILGLLAALITTASFTWAIWAEYPSVLGRVSGLFGEMGIDPALMYNLRGSLTVIFGAERAELINSISNVALAAGVLTTLWLYRGPWQPEGAAFKLRFAFSMVLGLIVTSHLYTHDALLVALPAALLAEHLRRVAAPSAAFLPLVLAPLLVLVSEFALGIRLPTLLLVGLAGWLWVALRRVEAA